MPLWLLLALPWPALVAYVVFRVRLPPALPPPKASRELRERADPPRVSVVVPARNEAENIGRVLRSLARSTWPRFEILVVDDRSDDGTGEIARSVAPEHAERIEVIDGEPLPEGWLGKPWACHQGARRARGELILFTDADTVHGPQLMERAVAALETEGADAVSVSGRQLVESFWERLVQPQIFVAMALRYGDLSRPVPRRRWRSAIANGQFILFRAKSYRAFGGHEAVREEVVEDLRLAQILVRDGWRFRMRTAEDAFATRMYRSLSEIVEGWSKNIVLGGLQTLPPALRPVTPPLMLLSAFVSWLLPPALLVAALAGAGGPALLAWAASVVGVSALFWCLATWRFRAPWWHGLLYPLGSAVVLWIVARSWRGMGEVTWKGRRYRTGLPAE